MKQKILKLAAAFAVAAAAAAYLPVIAPVSDTAVTVLADSNETPFVPIGNNSYTFTNNTDYVTATWNGQTVSSGATLKDSHSLVLSAERPFTYTVGNSVSTSPFKNEKYYVSLVTASDVTVDIFYASVQHDDGFGKDGRYIYLKPENFNSNDYFYIDKSMPVKTISASKNGDTVSFKTILDYPVTMYDESGNSVDLAKSDDVYSFVPTDGIRYYLVRNYDPATENNYNENELEYIPLELTVHSVYHDDGNGNCVKVELVSSNFNSGAPALRTDKTFSEDELVGVFVDKSTLTGLIMLKPGTTAAVYTETGTKVELTKLSNSDETSDNYTFRYSQASAFFLVKDVRVNSTYKSLGGNLGYCVDYKNSKTYIIYGFTPTAENTISDYDSIVFKRKSDDQTIKPSQTDSLPDYIDENGNINIVYKAIKFNHDDEDVLLNTTVGADYIVAIVINGTNAPDINKFYATTASGKQYNEDPGWDD